MAEKKSKSDKTEGPAVEGIQSGQGKGGRRSEYARAELGSLSPADADRIQVILDTDILDRWEGLSTTYEVWGSQPSVKYLTATLNNEDIRHNVSEFFISRAFALVIEKLLPAGAASFRTIKPKQCVFTKPDVFNKVNDVAGDIVVAGVVTELVLPMLMELGMVSNNIQFSTHTRYDFSPVTVNSIRNDVAIYQVLQTVKAAKAGSVKPEIDYSVKVLAELLSEAVRPIGLALLEYNDMTAIVDDMILGVRAHLDPTMQAGKTTGFVHSDWRNHVVIAELARNIVFVKEALALPPGTNLTPTSEGWRLREWAPIILAAIKSSERYAWVNKAEALRSYGCKRIRDGRGQVRSAVVYRKAAVQPIAQSVFVTQDRILPGTVNVAPTRDRLAEVIQATYGSAAFDIASGADLVATILNHAAEAGWVGMSALYVCDTTERATDVMSLAAMLSKKLFVHAGEKGVEGYSYAEGSRDPELVKQEWTPRWWFVTDTSELNLDIMSGTHSRSEVYTSDPAEVFLAHDDFEPKDALQPRPQVLGPAAFNTYVVDFDDRILHSIDTRFSFRIAVNDVVMQGVLTTSAFSTMKASKYAMLTTPHFNQAVIEGYMNTLTMANSIMERMRVTRTGDDGSVNTEWLRNGMPGDEFFSFFKRQVALHVLELSQQLSPAFRQDVHDLVIENSIARAKLSADESVTLRARLAQRTYAAAADVISLDFFLSLQGFPFTQVRELMTDSEMARAWLEKGSPRTKEFTV